MNGVCYPLRVRGLERVQLHADLTILAKLTCALARARAVPFAAWAALLFPTRIERPVRVANLRCLLSPSPPNGNGESDQCKDNDGRDDSLDPDEHEASEIR